MVLSKFRSLSLESEAYPAVKAVKSIRTLIGLLLTILVFSLSCLSTRIVNLTEDEERLLIQQLDSDISAERAAAGCSLLLANPKLYIERVGTALLKETDTMTKLTMIECLARTRQIEAVPYLEPLLQDHSQMRIGVKIGSKPTEFQTVVVSQEASRAIVIIRQRVKH